MRKRSVAVPLILLGTLGLSGCGVPEESVDLSQKVYQTKEECLSDWGEETACSQDPAQDINQQVNSGSTIVNPFWYGPRYYWDRDLNKPVSVASDGTKKVMNFTSVNRGSSPSNFSSSSGRSIHAGRTSVARNGFGSFHGSSGG